MVRRDETTLHMAMLEATLLHVTRKHNPHSALMAPLCSPAPLCSLVLLPSIRRTPTSMGASSTGGSCRCTK